MAELVLYHVRDRVGYITLNRPEKRNALSFEFVEEIKKKISVADEDKNCKVMVIQANGPAFCAGADLAYLQRLQSNTESENIADSNNLASLFRMIHLSKKVIISKVCGPALAGGCGLATICDFCFSSPSSTFGYTEVKIGFLPALVMVFLLRKTSEKNTREILLSGEIFNADKALGYQLINGIIESESLDEHVHAFAVKLCETASAQSLGMVKEMLGKVMDFPLEDAISYAVDMNVKARKSEDCKKGIAAFLNKEKISW